MDQKYFLAFSVLIFLFWNVVVIPFIGNMLQLWSIVYIVDIVFLLALIVLTFFLKMQKNQKIILGLILSFMILYILVPRILEGMGIIHLCRMMYTGPAIYISVLGVLLADSFIMDFKNLRNSPKNIIISAIFLIATFFILSIILSFEYLCFGV
ncbi:MAG: hypothetical protein GTN38_04210 [Candidatus Aenigmarchaeota archaeon]|nr:hypothetical protein [Candidatus Aenigmarchaeota archaeon]NIP40866.1 hypothetical protein [Candidatus Aenigmarchaeota archaeon]NIQ17980.1 hypothetical protein [Candidatus Aenigmarchaeota archaeon]NIS73569.1 hypothetical protein [Candidatus Aenigmarchaeota archaeon]